jgi:hypothetical protein
MNRMEKRQLKPHWLHRRRKLLYGEEVEPLVTTPGTDVAITPGGGISSTNVQAAIMELDAEKVAKAGDTMTGILNLNGTCTSNLHAAHKAYVDTQDALSVAKSGSTMTGLLTLSAAPTLDLHASTKKYVDDKVLAGGGYTDEQAQDACAAMIQNGTGITWAYNDVANTLTPTVTVSGGLDQTTADNRYVNVDGDIMTAALQLPAANPTGATHAAHKGYVDGQISTVTSSISGKADKTYVDSQDALKANTTYVDSQDALKASITYVDNQNALKANITYVDSQNATQNTTISAKADTSYVNSQDALKADITYVNSRPVGVCFPFGGKPSASATVFAPMSFPITVPASLTGTVCYCNIAPTGSVVFTLNKVNSSGTQTGLGTITVTAGSRTTVTLSGTGGSVATGEALQLIAPATQDGTMADIGVTIQVTRA